MSNRVNLGCDCGAVKGTLNVVPSSSFHVHCLCCDCQSFAAYLGKEDRILDEYGGTELFQTYPQSMEITQGIEQITCVQLREKGLFRWHTRCCNTPVANTLKSGVPFVGIPVAFMQFANEQEKDSALGPVIMKAFGKYAKGDMPADAHPRFPLTFMPKILGFMLKGKLGGKHQPSPFFPDGKPLVKARVL